MSVEKALENMVARSLDNKSEGDFVDKDGYLCCGSCKTRKQADVPSLIAGEHMRVGIMCQCKAAAKEQEEKQRKEREHQEMVSVLRSCGIPDVRYRNHRAEYDDHNQPQVSKICSDYIANWAEMKAANIGILLYGDVDGGKTFFACSIANALIDKGIKAGVTSLPETINRMQGTWDKDEIIRELQSYSLLVFDDLGIERDTSFGVEQVYNIVNSRAISEKPTIFTTNLSLEEIQNPKNLEYKRIYSRVLQMCPMRVMMKQQNRRVSQAEAKRAQALRIFGYGA